MSVTAQTPLNSLQLTDDEASNLYRARHLLRLVRGLANPQFEDEMNWININRESLAVYADVVTDLLPARF